MYGRLVDCTMRLVSRETCRQSPLIRRHVARKAPRHTLIALSHIDITIHYLPAHRITASAMVHRTLLGTPGLAGIFAAVSPSSHRSSPGAHSREPAARLNPSLGTSSCRGSGQSNPSITLFFRILRRQCGRTKACDWCQKFIPALHYVMHPQVNIGDMRNKHRNRA
jgi:hypothetical protein